MSNKLLTLSSLKSLDSKNFNETIQIFLSDGSTLLLDKKFRKTTIESILNRLSEIHKIVQNDKSLENLDLEKFTQLLLILNFTSLKSLELNSLQEELVVMNLLVDNELLEEIILKFDENCKEQIEYFNKQTFLILQKRLDAMSQQEEFMKILNEEIEKQKLLELGENVDLKLNEDTEMMDIINKIDDNLDVLKTIGIETNNKELELYTNKNIKKPGIL